MKLTASQYALLEHLCAVAVQQKAEARLTKKRFRQGWTYIRFSDRIKPGTIKRLIELGLADACCDAHPGTDAVRITHKGIEYLEQVRKETIYA